MPVAEINDGGFAAIFGSGRGVFDPIHSELVDDNRLLDNGDGALYWLAQDVAYDELTLQWEQDYGCRPLALCVENSVSGNAETDVIEWHFCAEDERETDEEWSVCIAANGALTWLDIS